MNRKSIFSVLAAFILLNFSFVHASVKDIYVSHKGDNLNEGTKQAPLATINTAMDLINATMDDATIDYYVIHLDKGTHLLTSTIEITHPTTKSITFLGEGDNQSIVSGSITTKKFTAVNDKLWRVHIPEAVNYGFTFEQIYINGERRFRAQTPNRGEFMTLNDVQHIPIDSTDIGRGVVRWQMLKMMPDQKLSFSNQTAGTPLVSFYHKWDVTRLPLLHHDQNGALYTGSKGFATWNTIDTRTRIIVENDMNFMDAPGEWILDKKGWLYYIPNEGETIESTTCQIPVIEKFITIQGKSKNQMIENINIENIRFENAKYQTPIEGNPAVQAAATIDAVIEADYARHINIRNCTIAHTGLSGIWFRHCCSHCSIEQCHIYDLGAGGVKIGAIDICDDHDEITHNIKVDNNIIQHGGFIFPCATGVTIFQASDNEITHNDIADFRYTGISVGWTWGYSFSPTKRNRIEYNHIHHLGWGELSDMGGVYLLGKSEGTSVSHNTLHHIYSLYYGGWGLYTDEGSSGITLECNLVYNCKSGGFHQHYGKDNIVRNNIFAGQIRTQLEATRVEQHTSFNFTNNIICFDNGELGGINWRDVKHLSDYNCYYDKRNNEAFDMQGLSWGEWQAKGQDTHSIICDPQFAAPEQQDYTPRNKEMIKQISFKPFNPNEAGVYGSAKWRKKAELDQDMMEAFNQLVKSYEDKNISNW